MVAESVQGEGEGSDDLEGSGEAEGSGQGEESVQGESEGSDDGEGSGDDPNIRMITSDELTLSDPDASNESLYQYPYLPPEILMMIVSMAVHSDIACIGKIALVSRAFHKFSEDHCIICRRCDMMRSFRKGLRPFHVRPDLVRDIGLVEGTTVVSVQRLLKQVGRGSGLAISLKAMLRAHPKWWSAWLEITPLKHGDFPDWYHINSVFWK